MLVSYLPRIGIALARGVGRPRLDALSEFRLPMRVWPSDVDMYLHMNNGRYLTLMDIGRFHFAQRCGLMNLMVTRRWWPVLGAATIKYRRELSLGERFELVTRIAGWDSKYFFIEQRFEVAGTVNAWAVVKGVFRHRGRTVPIAHVMEALGSPASPQLPEAVARWNASLDERGRL